MAKETVYTVRYFREAVARKTFKDAAEAVAFAVEKQKAGDLLDIGQVDTEVIDIKVIEGKAVKELKGNK